MLFFQNVLTVVRAFICLDVGLSNIWIALIASIIITAIFMVLAALIIAAIKLSKRHRKQWRHKHEVMLQIRDDLVRTSQATTKEKSTKGGKVTG